VESPGRKPDCSGFRKPISSRKLYNRIYAIFSKIFSTIFQQSGFVVCKDAPFLGAPPDGMDDAVNPITG
jgi:hypothetical protein